MGDAETLRWNAAPLALLAVVALSGCAHVDLEVPARTDDLTVRRKAFERLRPAGRQQLVETVGAVAISRETRAIVLAGGLEVIDPVDLLPAVLPGSQTALAVEKFEARQRRWSLWGGLALGTLAGGVALLSSTLFIPFQGDARTGVLLSGLALGVLGPLVSLILGAVLVGNTDADRERCFTTYERDLRAYLGVLSD